MNWRQIEKKLRKIGYTKGESSRHRTIWNCPCLSPNNEHAVGVGNHPNQEAYPNDYKRKLGPHLKDFGKI
jgi:hypothetical protein